MGTVGADGTADVKLVCSLRVHQGVNKLVGKRRVSCHCSLADPVSCNDAVCVWGFFCLFLVLTLFSWERRLLPVVIAILRHHLPTGTSRPHGLRLPCAIHIQHGQPRPIAALRYTCTHYSAVCCYNAPINFPFDILRAIYKSCRLSSEPSLMLGNNAAASPTRFGLSHNQVNKRL